MHAYTTANAYAGFQEDRLGRLAPGYLADFVVWSYTFSPSIRTGLSTSAQCEP